MQKEVIYRQEHLLVKQWIQVIRARKEENINIRHYWPFVRETLVEMWIPSQSQHDFLGLTFDIVFHSTLYFTTFIDSHMLRYGICQTYDMKQIKMKWNNMA